MARIRDGDGNGDGMEWPADAAPVGCEGRREDEIELGSAWAVVDESLLVGDGGGGTLEVDVKSGAILGARPIYIQVMSQ